MLGPPKSLLSPIVGNQNISKDYITDDTTEPQITYRKESDKTAPGRYSREFEVSDGQNDIK